MLAVKALEGHVIYETSCPSERCVHCKQQYGQRSSRIPEPSTLVSSQLSFAKSASGYEFAERGISQKKKKLQPQNFACSKVTVREPLLPRLPYQKKINMSRIGGFFFDIATAPVTVTVTLPVRAPETVPTTEKET